MSTVMSGLEFSRSVSEIVRAAVDHSGLSQAAVSRETGIPLSTLRRRLRGDAPFLVVDLFAIAKVVGVDVMTFWPEDER